LAYDDIPRLDIAVLDAVVVRVVQCVSYDGDSSDYRAERE
jgi:hypothetical protein